MRREGPQAMDSKLPQPPERRRYRDYLDMACAGLADELEAERASHRETRRELQWARETIRAAVDLIRKLSLKVERLQDINRRLRAEVVKLRDALLNDRRAA